MYTIRLVSFLPGGVCGFVMEYTEGDVQKICFGRKKLRDFIFIILKISGCNTERCNLYEFQFTDDACDGVCPMLVSPLSTGCNAV